MNKRTMKTEGYKRKEYVEPEIEIVGIEPECLLAYSSVLEKTDEEADEEYEVLSKEHNNSVWDDWD